ncbi:MAG: hypothetical protein RBT74_06735 [Tenuifilaceae bacterium]|jgi:hypothetical protein|nr:hypothetical protein [Tenuifilaceae bacterium]
MKPTAPNDFIEYVRTLMFWRLRLKNEPERTAVFIPWDKVLELIPTDTKAILAGLVASGELEVTQHTSPEGKTYNMYKALRPGYIVPHLLEPKGAPLTPLHSVMMQHLLQVELPDDSETSIYFKSFQLLKHDFLRLFFTVDQFCGRVHTPLTNLHRPLRKHLVFYGCPVASLDVAQMQPTILGKILLENIGANEFSGWISSGLDVYDMITAKANLETRDQGKKRFFEILFSKPNDSLTKMFGASDWITWINEIKSQALEVNPHSAEKPHSNLAYLLQSTEVKIMQKVWTKLSAASIPFISIHDEIITQKHHIQQAGEIFNSILKTEFTHYRLNSKAGDDPATMPTPTPAPQAKISLLELQRIWYCQMLEAQFKGETQPENTLKLGRCNSIQDAKELFTAHYHAIISNPTNETQPYLERLQTTSQVLTTNMN